MSLLFFQHCNDYFKLYNVASAVVLLLVIVWQHLQENSKGMVQIVYYLHVNVHAYYVSMYRWSTQFVFKKV